MFPRLAIVKKLNACKSELQKNFGLCEKCTFRKCRFGTASLQNFTSEILQVGTPRKAWEDTQFLFWNWEKKKFHSTTSSHNWENWGHSVSAWRPRTGSALELMVWKFAPHVLTTRCMHCLRSHYLMAANKKITWLPALQLWQDCFNIVYYSETI